MDWLDTVLYYSKGFAEATVFGFLFARFLQAVASPMVAPQKSRLTHF